MPWIQHFSEDDVVRGIHYAPENNTVLIQICDHDHYFVDPMYTFQEEHQFVFDDVTDESNEFCISDEQAKDIANALRDAYSKNRNVIVHCYAGLCRSSAVAICGQYIGFRLEDKIRWPNSLVELRVKTALGVSINEHTSVFGDIMDQHD